MLELKHILLKNSFLEREAYNRNRHEICKKLSVKNVIRLDQQFDGKSSHKDCRQAGQRVSGCEIAEVLIVASTIVHVIAVNFHFIALIQSDESNCIWFEASLKDE